MQKGKRKDRRRNIIIRGLEIKDVAKMKDKVEELLRNKMHVSGAVERTKKLRNEN